MIIERLQQVLEFITNSDQTGFISNRFIGENTRLLYAKITYTEAEQLSGLLVIVDYAKAFDTIEWNFIDKVLHLFNFGKHFSKWIKLLKTDSIFRIEQSCFFQAISYSLGAVGKGTPYCHMSFCFVPRFYPM